MKAGRHSKCTTKGISADALESTVLNLIGSLAADPANFALLGANNSRKGREAEIARNTAELLEVDRQIAEAGIHVERLMNYIRESGTPNLASDVALQAEKAKDQRVELENRRIQINARLGNLSNRTPAIADLCKSFELITRSLTLADNKNKCGIYNRIVRGIIVESARRIPGVVGVQLASRRTFRVSVSFNTDAVLQFGEAKVEQLMGSRGYSDIDLAVTMEIKSNRNEQKVVLMEHAYSVVSTTYKEPEIGPQAKTPSSENPVQRALRWHASMEASAIQAKDLAESEGVSRSLVSQHLALLNLPQLILDFLREGREVGLDRSFSLRELQRLLAMTPAEAVARFQAYVSGTPLQETLALESA